MKSIKKIVTVIVLILLPCLFGFTGYEAEGQALEVKEKEDSYILASGDVELRRSADIEELIAYASEIANELIFDAVTLNKQINISLVDITFSGMLSTESDIVIEEGAELNFNNLTLSLNGSSSLKIVGGSVDIFSSTIISNEASAVILDYYSTSSLTLNSSKIESVYSPYVIKVNKGSARLISGNIVNKSGISVYNKGSLFLGSSLQFDSFSYDIETYDPISLSAVGESFNSTLRVKYGASFSKGELIPVFRNATAEQLPNITLYDENGQIEELSFFEGYNGVLEKSFFAVYKPYRVSFYSNGTRISEELCLKNETVEAPKAEEFSGYRLKGWFYDELGDKAYDFSGDVNSDLTLYAVYELLAPSFEIGNLEFTYDGNNHSLSFDSITHPLDELGIYSYVWFNTGGDIVSKSDEVNVCTVSDSGSYICKVTFTVGSKSVVLTTPEIKVIIKKKTVKTPIIENTVYNGNQQTPSIYSNSIYNVESVSGINAGCYPVNLTLIDFDNYRWEEGEGQTFTAFFTIEKANNKFVDNLLIDNIFYGDKPKPMSAALFGSIKYVYSSSENGEYTQILPYGVGRYYVKAIVEESENYYYLESNAVEFNIYPLEVTSVYIKSYPDKTDYFAFELLDRRGLKLTVLYNNGVEAEVDGDKLSVFYQSADNFRYGDNGVVLEYEGKRCVLPVSVSKRDYIFSLDFSNLQVEYDGKYHTHNVPTNLPVGLDGIPLSAEVSGGGSDAGEYSVTLSFHTDSKNYNLPDKITKTLTVYPREANVIWSNLCFVYDGEVKAPSAYYIDVNGAKIRLEINGASINAGEGYKATASTQDKNYLLVGSETEFEIKRADYNLSKVVWDNSGFVYNGEVKRVKLNNLPNGVTVLGYANNTATNAGVYYATVTLSYDEKNYNKPIIPEYRWVIEKGNYDLSGFSFVNSVFVYDGETHYPNISGSIPVGKDGSLPSYELSKGASNVADGEVIVELSFKSGSDNYNSPSSLYAIVSLTPKPIRVIWGKLSFEYNGEIQIPSATSTECRVNVYAEGKNAGEYSAIAVSTDENYKIENGSISYIIEKAKNKWIKLPEVSNAFFGRMPEWKAEASFGEPMISYFTDEELKQSIDSPINVGKYYASISVAEGDNYLSVSSEPISFEIIGIIPVGLSVELIGDELRAFEKLSSLDCICTVKNNDGTEFEADWSEIKVIYENGDSFRAKDKTVLFEFGELNCSVDIKVDKNSYDMSSVCWENVEHIYDGNKKTPTLSGLPLGVTVTDGIEGYTKAGEYFINPNLSYDSENYNEPIIPEGKLIIKKCVLVPFLVGEYVYNSKPINVISGSELYTPVISEEIVDSGEYKLKVELCDTENYELSSNYVTLKVLPREITLKVDDVTLYLLEEAESYSYSVIEGEVCSNDELGVLFTVDGSKISLTVNNPNYKVNVIEGRIERFPTLSPDSSRALFITFLVFLLIALLTVVIITNRGRILFALAGFRARLEDGVKREKLTEDGIPELEEKILSVDVERADSLISDSIARTLERSSNEVIRTSGRRRAIINVDTLSEFFESGDVIDVNILKEKGLIPKDVIYYKVLARGVLDKALTVYANEFSLSAVKMIALTGGEAIKVQSKRE